MVCPATWLRTNTPVLFCKPIAYLGAADADACCRTPLDTAEHATLLRELERNRWNITHTADSLGVSRNTLYRKIRKHQIPLAE